MVDFDAITDWVEYLRDCLRNPLQHAELDQTVDVDAALGVLRGKLGASRNAAHMSDAALTLLAKGTPDEQRKLLQIALAGAPDLGRRVAAAARAWRGGPLDDRIRTLLLRGLEAAPTDHDVLAALGDEAKQGGERTIDAIDLAVPHNAAWVASHLRLLDASLDPDGEKLAFVALRTLPADLPALVDGIEAAGADTIARFSAGLARAPKHVIDRLRPVLASRAAFAGRVP